MGVETRSPRVLARVLARSLARFRDYCEKRVFKCRVGQIHLAGGFL